MLKQFTKEQFLGMLADEIKAEGTQKALAARLEVSESYLSEVLSNRREPGDKILRKMRLRAITNYVPRKETK